MSSTRRRRLAAGLAAAGMAVTVALAGCGADDGSSDTSSAGSAVDPAAEAPARGEAGAPEAAVPGGAGPAQDAPAQDRTEIVADERSIIYIGALSLRLADAGKIDAAAARAISIVTVAGGFVGADKRTSDDGHSQATLELRVPAEKFTSVVDELAGLGREESRAINTEDVTEAVVDLDARISTQQTSVNRTRALLARAESIAEIVSVEGELAKREAELASLQAKKRRLADLTSLSTVTLTLLGPDADVVEEEDATGFLAGVKAGWKAFVASMEILLTVLGALVPWLVALGLPIAGLVWLLRRAGRRSRPAAGPPAPPA